MWPGEAIAGAVAVVGLGATIALVRRAAHILREKNVDVILRHDRRRARERWDGTRHLFVTVTDHFEPYWHNTDDALAAERVRRWCEVYPKRVEDLRDRGGRAPRHAIFYPAEEYRPELLETIANLVRGGWADVDVHLHHDDDTRDGLREKLVAFRDALHGRHGLLRERRAGSGPVYAFIHGNWTLANSHPDGRDCGVDDELRVLVETGCIADFTYPSAPHPTQPPTINRIYRTRDLDRRRGHHHGEDVVPGRPGDGLLVVTGPLALNWRARRRGILPAVENGDLTDINPPTPARADCWVRTAVQIRGWPRWIIVKLYTHGAQERNARALLGEGPGSLRALYRDLLARYDDGERWILHFSTPWEIVRAVEAVERGDAEAVAAIESFSQLTP